LILNLFVIFGIANFGSIADFLTFFSSFDTGLVRQLIDLDIILWLSIGICPYAFV
jgi:hypothetical protein